MLTHLVILLDDTSTSYCHYENSFTERRLIDIDVLRKGIVWAMKENVNIQFVYPDYSLPEEYKTAIESIDHTKIGPQSCGEELDVIVIASLLEEGLAGKCCLWRCKLSDFIAQKTSVISLLGIAARLNIVLTDIPLWKQKEFDEYKKTLNELSDAMIELYAQRKVVQLNLLTDRLQLRQMNNCNAGDANVTLAPDGRFYVCPAFYPKESIGSLSEGLRIPNKQLFRLDHAPICRACDAFQCRRCVWMNGQLTLDCNTPSHEQCVAAHIERNASRLLQQKMKERGIRLENMQEIKEIDCLDPFYIVNKWK